MSAPVRTSFVAALLTLTLAVHAQDDEAGAAIDWPARASSLARRAERQPNDTRTLCELGWAYYQSRSPEPAASALDRGISLLGAPTTPALTQRLAACLYSRGRAAEATSVAGAIAFYERSIALRPHATVQARLDGARRFVAAQWTQTQIVQPQPADAAVTSAIGRPASLLDRFTSASLGEVQVLFVHDPGDILVVARRSGGAWASAAAWEAESAPCESGPCGPGRSWLEAPLAGELVRIVVVYSLYERRILGCQSARS